MEKTKGGRRSHRLFLLAASAAALAVAAAIALPLLLHRAPAGPRVTIDVSPISSPDTVATATPAASSDAPAEVAPAAEPVASAARGSSRPADAPSIPRDLPIGHEPGQLAPDFALPGLRGGGLGLAQLRGRVVVLDFWASWCVPCRATMPSLEALVARFSDRGVVLVGVSLDRTAEDATAYLEQSGSAQLVALWGSLVEARDVASRYEVFTFGGFGIPHTFVIDRQGIVRFSGHPATLTDDMIKPWL